MDKHLQHSFIRPMPRKIGSHDSTRPVDYVTGQTAKQMVESSLAKGDQIYQQMRSAAVALFTPLDNLLPHDLTSIENKVKAELGSLEAKVASNPTLLMLAVVLHETDYISTDPTDRNMWFNHMLTLMVGEVGPNLNPKTESMGVVRFQQKDVKYHVYGLMQQTMANWDNGIRRFNDSVQGQALIKSGVMTEVARIFGIRLNHLIDSSVEYGNKFMETYQFVPIMGQLLGLKQSLYAQFSYDKVKGWTPKNALLAKGVNWQYLQSHYPLLMKNYYGGRQMILTMMHVNGTGFLSLDHLGNHLDRVTTDVRNLAVIIGNRALRQLITISAETYDIRDKLSKMLGDPTDPTEVVESKKRSPKYLGSKFGSRPRTSGAKGTEHHYGIDLKVFKVPVHSVGPGKVTYAQFNNGGYGNLVKILHDNGYETRYAHLSKIDVKKGDIVTTNQKIGTSGNTGSRSTGYHLHFEVRKGDTPLDPLDPSQTPFDLNNIVS